MVTGVSAERSSSRGVGAFDLDGPHVPRGVMGGATRGPTRRKEAAVLVYRFVGILAAAVVLATAVPGRHPRRPGQRDR